jgi:hypothetical protein
MSLKVEVKLSLLEEETSLSLEENIIWHESKFKKEKY